MTDQEVFLGAIRQEPECDTPRLVYADWAEEHAPPGTPEGELLLATAQFIRLTCDGKRKSPTAPMPPPARLWLQLNWLRLVPSLAGRHVPDPECPAMPEFPSAAFRCRVAFFFIRLPYDRQRGARGPTHAWFRVELGFRRGFCDFASITSDQAARQLIGPLRADQPFVKLYPKSRTAYRAADLGLSKVGG